MFIMVVVLRSNLLELSGGRVEMRVGVDEALEAESIIHILRQGDTVTLNFCPSENIMEVFRIHITPVSVGLPTLQVAHIEVDMHLFKTSDFYVNKLLALVELLRNAKHKIYLQNSNTYLFVNDDILELGQCERCNAQKSINDEQMIRLAIFIKDAEKINTLMLPESAIQIRPVFALELLRAMGWKITDHKSM